MPVPFGVSIGDFIATIGLAQKIVTSLRDSGGATVQLSGLLGDLNSYISTLNAISALLSAPTTACKLASETALLNGVGFHIAQCQTLFQQFMRSSAIYRRTLIQSQSPGKSGSINRGFRKIRWTLYREDDARRLEQRFRAHLSALEIYLVAISIVLQKGTAEEQSANHAALQRTTGEILTLVKVQKTAYPNQLGHTWQGDNANATIFFEDVLGRRMHLPALFFRDLNTFQSMLEIIFRDHPGIAKIQRGEYELVDEKRGELVSYGEKAPDTIIKNINRGTLSSPRAWEKRVHSGARIRMNMIVYSKNLAPRSKLLPSSQRRCPRCGCLSQGMRIANLRTCITCNLQFRSSFQEFRDYWNIMMKKPDLYEDQWTCISRRVDAIEPPSLEQHFSYPCSSAPSPPATTADLCTNSQDQPQHLQILQGEDQYFARIHCLHAFEVPCDTGKNPPSMIGWRHSRNPVMHAAGQGDTEWMRTLLDDGAEINTPDYSGRCPLVYAAESGNIDLVRLLIAAGADLDASPAHVPGETALLVAADLGHEDVVRVLLERGVAIHGKPNIGLDGKKGWTALHAAARAGHIGIVRVLVEKGAELDAVTEDGEISTPLGYAKKAGQEEVIQYLEHVSALE